MAHSLYIEAKDLQAKDLICIPVPYEITQNTENAPCFSTMVKCEGSTGMEGVLGMLEAEEGNTELIDRDSLPNRYTDFLPDEDPVGCTYEVNVYDLRKNPRRYEVMRKFLADKSFPLYMEYQKVKGFYYDLKSRVERRRNARRLFDD